MGKHVMLSYEWNNQELVKQIYAALQARGMPVWMDINGGMEGNIYDSMAQGVDNAAVVVTFLSPKYQESKNCKRELSYAMEQDVPVVPVMTLRGWKAKEWLGLLTAGLLWIDFRDTNNFDTRVNSLANEILHKSPLDTVPVSAPAPGAPVVKKNPGGGRAFRNKMANKYLAESGEHKFHPASGDRSNIVLRDIAEDTSFWVEIQANKEEGIYNYKNFSSNGFLGYDPNGDYIYTKGQAYGAEQWKLIIDENASSGEREIVIFADYGKKYLAIINGQLTGVSTPCQECIWVVE